MVLGKDRDMERNIRTCFEETVIPLITERCPGVSSEMSVQIRGSYGLGIADEFSDSDAVIWLDDTIWRAHGGQVQLMIVHELPRFGPRKISEEHKHPEICVWPLSWLGPLMRFVNGQSELPWEEVSPGDLFEIQNCLVLRDPRGIFQRLREGTRPDRFPQHLWKKRLIQTLKKLDDDITEYRQVIRRKHMIDGRAGMSFRLPR